MLKFNFKKAKAFLFALPLTVIIFSQSVFAADYTVVRGDSLYTIGSKFNTTVSALKQSNNLSSNTIYQGQVLNVPGKVYIVRAGDTLYKIARYNGVSLYSLRNANNKWNDYLYVGQRLIIPASSQSSAKQSVIPYTSSDVDLLARLITAEADGQPYSAQVAVGAVIINRVQDSRFPKTIRGVIYQIDGGYYQFTPVENGMINKPATQTAKNAAYDALYGSDPTKGAVYYFDDSTTNKWVWSKPIAARIGNMVFTY
jgi:spore germination cell wall hydrolase CwlJ-like protein